MKTYEEMTRSVLNKLQTRKAAQKRRNSKLFLTAACLCSIALAVSLLGKIDFFEDPDGDIRLEGTVTNATDDNFSATSGSENEAPRLVLLCSASKGETPVTMKENIKIPYKAELRVRDISSMTEEEVKQVSQEENAYIDELFGKCSVGNGYSRYKLDNVLVTTISIGEFGIKLDDMVARIRVSVTENGAVISFPRVEGCKTSAYTFKEDQQLLIDIDGESLKECLAENGLDTLGLCWNISPWAVVKLDETPDMDLSQFSDRITITIDYTDGRVEEATILMLVDSNGQISTILEGTTVTA